MGSSCICRPWKLTLLIAAFSLERAKQGGLAARCQSALKKEQGCWRNEPQSSQRLFLNFCSRVGPVPWSRRPSEAWVLGALFILHVSIIVPCESDSAALYFPPCTDIISWQHMLFLLCWGSAPHHSKCSGSICLRLEECMNEYPQCLHIIDVP